MSIFANIKVFEAKSRFHQFLAFMVHQAQAKNQIKVVPKKHAHPDNYIQILSLRVFAHHFFANSIKQTNCYRKDYACTDRHTDSKRLGYDRCRTEKEDVSNLSALHYTRVQKYQKLLYWKCS